MLDSLIAAGSAAAGSAMSSFGPKSLSSTNRLVIEAYSDPDCSQSKKLSRDAWTSDFKPKVILDTIEFKPKKLKGLLQDPRHVPIMVPQPRTFGCEVSIMIPFSNSLMMKKFKKPSSSADDVDYVSEQLEALEKVHAYDSDNHRYPFLLIKTGAFERRAVLLKQDVTDTVFNKDNSYKSLKVKLNFQEVASTELINNYLGKNSPDMTHHYIVKSGDTLTKISKDIYGSINYHLDLARFNNIINIRKLEAGARLIIPPLK